MDVKKVAGHWAAMTTTSKQIQIQKYSAANITIKPWETDGYINFEYSVGFRQIVTE